MALSVRARSEDLPTLFLVGDSISIYYTPYLETDVSASYRFSRKTSLTSESIAEQLSDPNVQGDNSRIVLEYLEKRYSEPSFAPDIVLINCGLHDIKRIPQANGIAIDSAEYRINLGYNHLVTEQEGAWEARWLNTLGVSAYVLQYRLAPRYLYPIPQMDGQRAVRYVCAHAKAWHLKSDAIGVWGFSAGSHLAGFLATADPYGLPELPSGSVLKSPRKTDAIRPGLRPSRLRHSELRPLGGYARDSRFLVDSLTYGT